MELENNNMLVAKRIYNFVEKDILVPINEYREGELKTHTIDTNGGTSQYIIDQRFNIKNSKHVKSASESQFFKFNNHKMLKDFGLLGKNRPEGNPALPAYDNQNFFNGLIKANKKLNERKQVLQE